MRKITNNQVKEIRDENVIYPFYMAKQFLDIDISELNLSVRSYNCLRRAGWNTVGDILKSIDDKQDLRRVRNLGSRSADEILQILIYYQQDMLSTGERNIYNRKYNELNKPVCEAFVKDSTNINFEFVFDEKILDVSIA